MRCCGYCLCGSIKSHLWLSSSHHWLIQSHIWLIHPHHWLTKVPTTLLKKIWTNFWSPLSVFVIWWRRRWGRPSSSQPHIWWNKSGCHLMYSLIHLNTLQILLHHRTRLHLHRLLHGLCLQGLDWHLLQWRLYWFDSFLSKYLSWLKLMYDVTQLNVFSLFESIFFISNNFRS